MKVLPATDLVRQPFPGLRCGMGDEFVQYDIHLQIARDGGVGLFEEPPHVGAGIAVAQVGQYLAGGLSAAILRDHAFAKTPAMRPDCVTQRVTRRTRPATGITPLAGLPCCLEAGRPRLLAVYA